MCVTQSVDAVMLTAWCGPKLQCPATLGTKTIKSVENISENVADFTVFDKPVFKVDDIHYEGARHKLVILDFRPVAIVSG